MVLLGRAGYFAMPTRMNCSFMLANFEQSKSSPSRTIFELSPFAQKGPCSKVLDDRRLMAQHRENLGIRPSEVGKRKELKI
jgi:hypothetical protein